MDNTKLVTNIRGNEKGSILLLAIVILFALTLIAIGSSNTTIIEYTIAGNEKCITLSRYNAETAYHFGLAILELGRGDRAFDLDQAENLSSISNIFPADTYSLAGDAPDYGVYFWEETPSGGTGDTYKDWLYDPNKNLAFPYAGYPQDNPIYSYHEWIPDFAPDIRILALESSAVDIDILKSNAGPGESVENRSGYEGLGSSLSAGFVKPYRIDAVGFACNASTRTIVSVIVNSKK